MALKKPPRAGRPPQAVMAVGIAFRRVHERRASALQTPSWPDARMDEQHGVRVVKAQVPLSEMFRIRENLFVKTRGPRCLLHEFGSYAEVPRAVADGDRRQESRGN